MFPLQEVGWINLFSLFFSEIEPFLDLRFIFWNVDAYNMNYLSSRAFVFVYFKGCGMGPWLVLVSPCFRENAVAICKIGSFLCSLDNLLQKNVIVFFFENQISKWRSFEKRAIFDLLFTFFSHQGKVTKFLQHISHSHTYTYFAHPNDFFCLTNFEKKTQKKNMNLSGTISLDESWCWFLFAPFWNNQ